MWDDKIRENKGDSWCLTVDATAEWIKKAGCAKVDINCAATDVGWVAEGKYMEAYRGPVDLKLVQDCIEQKCGNSNKAVVWTQGSVISAGGVAAVVGCGIAMLMNAMALRRSVRPLLIDQLLG